jgi:hypothetical protein
MGILTTGDAVISALREGAIVVARSSSGADYPVGGSPDWTSVTWFDRACDARHYLSVEDIERAGTWESARWTFHCARPALTHGASCEAAVERLISAARAYRERGSAVSTRELEELAAAADNPSLGAAS